MSEIKQRYETVLEKIAQARAGSVLGQEVALIAVSKTQPPEAVEELYRLGHRDFGENYVQELCEKAAALEAMGCTGIRWHFIGHLQTNKAKDLVEPVYCVHSVDSERVAREIAKRWSLLRSAKLSVGPLPIFVEVNLDGEESKSGVKPDETPALAERLASYGDLRLLGLMAIPSPGSGVPAFEKLRALEERCRPWTRGRLSMGMTQDYEEAIRAGATHVRVGTGIFGERTPRKNSDNRSQ